MRRCLTTPCFTIARHTDSPPSNKQKVQHCYFVTIQLSNTLPDIINILFSNTAAIFSFQVSCYSFFFRPIHRAFALNGPTMDHTPDCDEQSEVLFVFTEDAADNQSPPATSPPPTAPPPPHLTESADQAFWSGVYTLDPPHALMGVLTDLHIHRFLLHQHLATHTHTALSETPIGHQPLTDTLPQPIQRIIAIYHSNLQRAQHHTRLALNAIDSLARFPPAAYFTDPNLSTSDPQHLPHEAFSAPSGLQPGQPIHIPPIRRYPLPTASNTGNVVQHVSTQTSSPWVSVLDTHLTPPTVHQSQQTTPPPATHSRHIQTDINAIVYYPAFTGIPASPHTEQPTSSDTTTNISGTTSPTPTAAANKQPYERWQYVNLIPTPTVTFQHTKNNLSTFLPPLAAPHAASEPRPHHALLPQPELATPTPARGLRGPLPHRCPNQLHNNSSPPCNSCRSAHRQHYIHLNKKPFPQPPADSPSTHRMAHISRQHRLYPHSYHYTSTCLSATTAPMARSLSNTTTTTATNNDDPIQHHTAHQPCSIFHNTSRTPAALLRLTGTSTSTSSAGIRRGARSMACRQSLIAPQLCVGHKRL